MKLSKSWIVASKDLKIFRKKKGVVYGVVLFPLFVAVGLPLVLRIAGARSGGIPPELLPRLLDAFSFFFIVPAAILPTAIASYSLVGGKSGKESGASTRYADNRRRTSNRKEYSSIPSAHHRNLS